jgi:cell division septal protein FtsQ
MADDKISENIEEYLEVLYRNGSNGEQVSTTQLSKDLGIAPGSVTQMLKKLEDLGYIEYTPYKAQDGTIIDDELFTLKMNDGNTVMIDIVNIKNLNKYTTIYASLGMDQTKGIVYLDTIIDERLLFKSYETIALEEKIEQEKEEEKNKEDKPTEE